MQFGIKRLLLCAATVALAIIVYRFVDRIPGRDWEPATDGYSTIIFSGNQATAATAELLRDAIIDVCVDETEAWGSGAGNAPISSRYRLWLQATMLKDPIPTLKIAALKW